MSPIRFPHASLEMLYSGDAFSRRDEKEDGGFYSKPRLVHHLDAGARSTVEKVLGSLVVEPRPHFLDLMAGWDSHLPPALRPARAVGLGLNREELSSNPALTEIVLHDLNRDPCLPFADGTFDVVVNTVSVDYLTRPFEVFHDTGRVLKPGGLFVVIFSSRMFPEKAVKIWREASERERIWMVEDFFAVSGRFERPRTFAWQGRPRPSDDKYSFLGIRGDPVYAVFADRKGGDPARPPRPLPVFPEEGSVGKEDLARKMSLVKRTLRCPYCGERLRKWQVPDNPFLELDQEYLFLCFNDNCPYLLGGWDAMHRQGNLGFSHRMMFDPAREICSAVPIATLGSLKEGIVDPS